MQICYASEPAPEHENEDYLLASGSWCVVLDGATERPDIDSGCSHGVRWYVSRLALSLGAGLETRPGIDLRDALEGAIRETCQLHSTTCDLANPDSPSSVVVIVRERQADVDYLVLADSTVVLDVSDEGPRIVTDDRTAHLPSRTVEAVRSLRNSAQGFWVASTAPEAAGHALTGSVPKARIRRGLVLTDGAARLVDRYGWSWTDVLDLAQRSGPSSVITHVRRAELSAGPTRGKKHDDATVACIGFTAPG